MIKTESYIKSMNEENVKIGHKYYWGELTDGSPAANDSLSDGVIAMYNAETADTVVVTFEMIEFDPDNIMDSIVLVTDIR